MAPHLLDLPRETRDNIYFILFNSTRLRFGIRLTSDGNRRTTRYVKPAANSLAILRACHQINAEAHDAWLGRVTFYFQNARALMEKLYKLPGKTISQIRHILLFDHWNRYKVPSKDGPEPIIVHYPLFTHLRLFQSLQLDRLTILQGCCHSILQTRNEASSGAGWKEFRAVNRGFVLPKWRDVLGSEMQSSQNILLERDGLDSGAFVVTYHNSTTIKPVERKLDPLTNYNEVLPAYIGPPGGPEIRELGLPRDDDIHTVMRRGNNADIKTQPNYVRFGIESPEDIIRFQKRLGWELMFRYMDHYCVDTFELLPGEDYDEYDDVDDFPWHERKL